MDKKRPPIPVPVGGSALLVIFAVLCLTTFAMMALATVQANRRMTAASADAVCAYYRADAQAEETLAKIRGGEAPPGVKVSGTVYSYTVRISGTQNLQVKVRLNGKEYSILEWRAVSTTSWTPDEELTVWDGGTTK